MNQWAVRNKKKHEKRGGAQGTRKKELRGVSSMHFHRMAAWSSSDSGPPSLPACLLSVATPAEPRGEKIFYFCKFWVVPDFRSADVPP